jgi:hypothetical protein
MAFVGEGTLGLGHADRGGGLGLGNVGVDSLDVGGRQGGAHRVGELGHDGGGGGGQLPTEVGAGGIAGDGQRARVRPARRARRSALRQTSEQ